MHELTCYAGKPTATPACEVPLIGDIATLVTTGNSAANNSQVFYAIVGGPDLLSGG